MDGCVKIKNFSKKNKSLVKKIKSFELKENNKSKRKFINCLYNCNSYNNDDDSLERCKKNCGKKDDPSEAPLPQCESDCYTNDNNPLNKCRYNCGSKENPVNGNLPNCYYNCFTTSKVWI